MCGRYYVDDETARQIEKLVKDIDIKIKNEKKKGDIRPSNSALVLTGDFRAAGHTYVSNSDHSSVQPSCRDIPGFLAAPQLWGFPGIKGKGIIFNARSESALEKRMFRDSILERRCIIPASGFYEWNKAKEKHTFMRQDSAVLFMAGFYNRFSGEDHFVILTTEANSSVMRVHDRMPLILEQEEISDWIYNDQRLEELLYKTPVLLKSESEYEQQSLSLF